MLTGLVAVAGLVLLLVMALCIGMSLDTEGQRRERQRLAEERRLWCDMGRAERGSLCDRCPYGG